MNSMLLLQPAVALLLLTFLVAMVMLWTRVFAMKKFRVAPQSAEDASSLKALLPRNVMRISDNYNHLHEQPIVFYTLCILITLLGFEDSFYVYLAWGYVLLRLLHSITQIIIADVMKRFVLFLLSWLTLGVMIIKFSTQIF